MMRTGMLLAAAMVGAAGVAIQPAPAGAQLGGLVKKAKDAAAKKVESQPASKPKDAFGPPLTESLVDAVIRGATAGQVKLEESMRLAAANQQVSQKVNESSSRHADAAAAFDRQRTTVLQCQGEEYNRINEVHQEQMQKYAQSVASDPAAIAKIQRDAIDNGRQVAALLQKGDTAGVRKYQMQQMNTQMKAVGIDLHADTAAVVRKCGAEPQKPEMLAEDDAALERWRKSEERVRQLQDSATIVGVATSGLPKQTYAVVRERIAGWLHEQQGGSAQTFTADERKILEARRGAIQKAGKVFVW